MFDEARRLNSVDVHENELLLRGHCAPTLGELAESSIAIAMAFRSFWPKTSP
ncbi:hypothetical protein [Candidatus Amarobacter glycogenicus]|uniref:hypothetical protein n=1 Tax=Candidatus Amarobacter glycogenicus TaxID=3140699 RepID=UPI0031CC3875